MKLPNGYGSIVKMPGKRRKPWAIRVVTGRDEKGNLIRKYVGYAETRTKAMQMLAEYNDNPYDVEASKKTFAEIYELWKKNKFDDSTSPNTVKNYVVAYNHCSDLHSIPMCDIRPAAIQNVIDQYSSHDSAKRALNLISQMYRFCIDNEILKKNYADAVKIKQKREEAEEKNIFTENEINAIWGNSDKIKAQMILMLIYTGLRIGEFLALKKDDIHIEEQWLYVSKSKTENGVRKVPIHDRVLPFFQASIERSKGSYAIVNEKGEAITSDNFRKNYLSEINKTFNMNHTCHECRHTFISRATIAGCDPIYIRKIVGHASMMTLTERTYTHIDIQTLLEEVRKIK